MKIYVVTTTINLPTFLQSYKLAAEYWGTEVQFVVNGDNKTPKDTRQFCEKLGNCEYMDLNDQDKYLKKFPELRDHLPENTIARRNVGHLYAYEQGADFIIMLDDDNLSDGSDFVRSHYVGEEKYWHSVASTSGWFNIASVLSEKHGVEFYPRGYPPAQRWKDGEILKGHATAVSAVNAGLWTNDPDIDAITRLERRLLTTGFKEGELFKTALALDTWSPWNCQNTSISREALPSYFLSPHTGRHLDIWASYITNKCIQNMGQVVTFGLPLAYHDRSPHNLYKDLDQELPWIQSTDEFCNVIRTAPKRGESDTYSKNLRDVTNHMLRYWSHTVKMEYLHGLHAWSVAFQRLGVQ